MKKTKKQTKLRPFHETIVDAIREAETFTSLETLGSLIENTKIPENHGAIITAWKEIPNMSRDLYERVLESLLAQKRTAAKKAKDNFDKLRQDIEKLLPASQRRYLRKLRKFVS